MDGRSGEILLEITGDDLTALINEAGGHRIQRVPPTERKGRVHTSTVTVAIMDEVEQTEITYNTKDFKIEWYSGTGCGGQFRNKHENSCRLTHLPTGIVATAQTRSRENSLKLAKETLLKRLNNSEEISNKNKSDAVRKTQVGSGMRGDKIRTYQFQNDIVTDHRTGKKVSLEKIMKGNFDLLW